MISRFYKKIIDYYTIEDKKEKEACFYDLLNQAYIVSFAVDSVKYEVSASATAHYPKTFNKKGKAITIMFESDIKSNASLIDYLVSVILDFHNNKRFNKDMQCIIEDLKKIQENIKNK